MGNSPLTVGPRVLLALNPKDGVPDQVGGVLKHQLALDVLPVSIDCLYADLQLDRNLSASQALAEKSKYMEIAVRKARDVKFASRAGAF